MPLFSSLYTGVSGLKTSQIGIHTTAHNLANIYTEGYVRQQISYADASYTTVGRDATCTWRVGLGVVASETRHIRDLLLDKAYRAQAGRENYYSVQYEACEEVENIMKELNSEPFQKSLTNLWEAMNELSKGPDSSVSRAELVMSADDFVTQVNSISKQLSQYQYNLNQEVQDTVDTINSLADQIDYLNGVIVSIEAPNVEGANDYRDQRDLALDKLSQLINISYSEDENGLVTVRAEGQEFIIENGVLHMEAIIKGTAENPYLTPVWPHLENKDVFHLNVEISSAHDNDIGRLKGLLQARGDHIADYSDIPKLPAAPKQEDYVDGAGQPDTAAYEAARKEYWDVTYPAYETEAREYNLTIGSSVIMKTQAMFDQLINTIVTMTNDLLCPNKETEIAAGTTLTIAAGTNFKMLDDSIKAEMGTPALDDDGNLINDVTFTLGTAVKVQALDTDETGNGYDGQMGNELFSRNDTQSRYTEMKAADGTIYYVYNKKNIFGEEGKYSAGNLRINQTVLEETSALPLWNTEEEAGYGVVKKILEAWSKAKVNLDPNNLTKKDIQDYYQAMVDVIGNDGYIFKSITENQQTVVGDIDAGREAVTGVSSEEELTNIIKFQNAYNANSRFINAIAEMIDTLINRVGVH